MVLHRILGITTELTRTGTIPPRPIEGQGDDWVHITLIALPLVPDIITKQIASKVFTSSTSVLYTYIAPYCEASY